MLTDVADAAGNMVPWPISWSFAVADYGANATTVRISGLLLNTTYQAFQAKSGETDSIRQDLAAFLSIPIERIIDVHVSAAAGINAVAVTFVIAPPGADDSKTSVSAAQEIIKECAKGNHALTGSLSTVMTSKVSNIFQYSLPR